MKRFYKIIQLCPLAILTLLSSCESNNGAEENKNTDSTTTEVETIDSSFFEQEKINIIDTLSFSLTLEGKEAIEAYNKLKEPSEYYEFDEEKINTTTNLKDLYEFYLGQENFWWRKTAWAEKSKIQSVERIIEEIGFNPETKTEQLTMLEKYQVKLKTLFLSRKEISDPAKIPYDDITTALLDTIIKTGESIPKMNGYQAFNALKFDVDSLHNNAQLSLRRTHIAALDSLNMFIYKNKEALIKEGIDTNTVQGWAY